MHAKDFKLWMINDLLRNVCRIKIAYRKNDIPYLLNVVKRGRDVVATLGFPRVIVSIKGD